MARNVSSTEIVYVMGVDVTIGIPVYNSEKYLKLSILSALNQTYNSYEILVVDDGSNDKSMNIIQQLVLSHPRGNSLRIISHTTNVGVSKSRNDIIDNAKGKYLFFMDSDDIISEGAIALMIQVIREYNAEICFGSYEKIDIWGKKLIYQYPFIHLNGEDQLAIFAYRKFAGIQASACNYIVKTSLLREKQHRFINTNYWEDYIFTFDLVTFVSHAVLLPNITYSYICHEGSLSQYQRRSLISKEEIMRNIEAIDYLKQSSLKLHNKVYYPNRCYNLVMMDFYIAFDIIIKGRDITPPFSNKEIKAILFYPWTFRQICSFRYSRLKNFFLFMLGKLPDFLCVACIWMIGKAKKNFNILIYYIKMLYLHKFIK